MKTVCEVMCMEVSPLAEEGLFDRWMDRMPESRRRKVTAFRHEDSRRLSLGAGILLYKAMERRGIDGRETEIAEGPWGQPYLPDYPGFRFSLSHAGVWALCAVSDAPVGCDAERIDRGNLKVADRFFRAEEKELLRGETDPEERDRLFTRIWTRKESYLKATGRGLSLEMDSFSVITPEPGVWYAEKEMAAGYVFSCCVIGGDGINAEWRETTPLFHAEPNAVTFE